MSEPVLLVLGLAAALAFAIVAKRLALPYPIVFVVAGTVLAFAPGLPAVRISPDWIFLSILPPLLFSAGWNTDWALFRANLRPILLLAVGLVVVTTVVVAFAAERLVPGLGLAGAFVLGAIVSPPDAIAAAATFERFAVPRRIVAILEGEGLVNDATALVIYAYAVGAVTTGIFSLPQAAGSFVLVAVGGVAVGGVVAWAVEQLALLLRRYDLSDSLIENLTIIGAPYAAYLGGQALHVSGVLAVVVAGILVSRRSSVVFSPESRLIGTNVWTLWTFVLNAYVFLAIGLQLRALVRDGPSVIGLLPAALAISAAMIVLRIAWIYATAWLSRAVIPGLKKRDPLPVAAVAVIGWTGMRGIVSLAAALALPYTTENGTPFPGRAAIVFITFVVIFVTLVGQGLSLIPLLRWLRLEEDGDGDRRETEVRLAALEGGLARIAEMENRRGDDPAEADVLARLRDEYEHRIEHLRHHGTGETETDESRFDHAAQLEALHAERNAIRDLRDRGQIPDEIFRKVQYDLDLAEQRMF